MSFVKNFIRDNSSQIEKYKNYFKNNDWSKPFIEKNDNGKIISSKYYYVDDIKQKGTGDLIHEGKSPEYKIQDTIVQTVLDRLKHFYSIVESDIGRDKKVDSMIKKMSDFINQHLKKVDNYLKNSNSLDNKEENELSEKTVKDYQSDEIKFDNILYKNKAKIKDTLDKLNLDKKNEDSIVEFLDGIKAPLSMHHILSEMYPEIKRRVEDMGIDFTSPPKNEMLIHIENPPEWNEEKHYFEQDKKTLQFYVDEYKKIRDGITIEGVHITPWMYCHLNVFKTPIPVPITNPVTGEVTVDDEIKHPPLRDNEWFIIQDNYEKARIKGKMMFLCATRRAAKTTLIASHLYHKGLCGKRTLVVAGGSAKDLGQIEGNFRIATTRAHPAFATPNITDDWKKEVKIGIKKKNQKDILLCTLNIVNLNSGGEKASERLAGFTPDAFVLDECMKNPFIDQLNAAKPAFESPYGKRLVAILSGTGSANDDLTKDALKILARPDDEGILNMDWNTLERGVPVEAITWKRRDFGTFLPGQMSAKDGMIKIEKTLTEYLQLPPNKKLDAIKIMVTDWKNCIKIIKEDRKKLEGNKKSLTKEIVYFPIDPEEIFLSGKTNPFPHEEIKRFRLKIEEEGNIGKKVTLSYNKDGVVTYDLSNKEYPELQYPGGFHDSPVTIFQDPVPNPPWEFYVAGCLTEGEVVLTDKGIKKVEDIDFNDKLINKDGETVKIKALQKHYKENEDVYELRMGNTLRKTTFTKEHPIYICRHDIYTEGVNKGRTRSFNFDNFSFKKVSELQKNDWVKYPNIYIRPNNFDITTLWDDSGIRIDRRIDNPLLKKDFWLFIGTFLGDGYVLEKGDDRKITVCFGAHETEHIKNYKNIVKNIFKRSPTSRKRGNKVEITFTNEQLGKFLKYHFGRYAEGKYISEWVKKIPNELKYELLCGYLNSDGCTMNLPNGYLLTEFVSISLKLLEDFQDILFSLGLVSSLTLLRSNSETIFPNGIKSKTKKTYMLRMNQIDTLKMHNNFRSGYTMKVPDVQRELKQTKKGKGVCFLSDDLEYIYFKIKDIKKSSYTGWVYNFECDTNTFLAHHITTHNCDDYKQEQADSDSLGSFSIIRRDSGELVASYHSRPDPHSKLHMQGYLLLQMYNCPVFMENADMDFKTYLDNLGVYITDKYLIKSIDFLGDMSMDNNGRRMYGWTPTPKNKWHLFGILLAITKKQDMYEDKDGNVKIKWGFERFRDTRILQEMENFKPDGNFDTLISLMSAIGYDYYLHTNYGAPKPPLTAEEKRLKEKRLQELKNNRKPRGLFPQGRRRQW